MSKTEDGGPAFPFIDSSSTLESPGMSLRDYFATEAMLGTISNSALTEGLAKYTKSQDEMYKLIAESAYKMADTMLKARQS